jgi:hypothetical protein
MGDPMKSIVVFVCLLAACAPHLRIVDGLVNPGARMVLDLEKGTADAVTRGPLPGGGVVLGVSVTGDLTQEQRTEVFDAFVASAYGLELHGARTPEQLTLVYQRDPELSVTRAQFVATPSGQPMQIALPSPSR